MNTLVNKKNISGLGIRGKMLLGFSMVILLLLLAVSTTLFILSRTESFAQKVIKVDLVTYDILVDLNSALFKTQLDMQNLILAHDPQIKPKLESEWEIITSVQNKIDKYSTQWSDTSFLEKWEKLKTLITGLKAAQFQTITDLNSNETQKNLLNTILLMNQISDQLNIVGTSDTTTALMDIQTQNLHFSTNKILDDLSQIRIINYVLLVISIIASIMIALITARKILFPLNNAIRVAKKIADGDRQIDIEITTHDETGELLSALDIMQNAIKKSEIDLIQSEAKTRELFERIVKSATQFREHSSKVAAGDLRQQLILRNSGDENDIMVDLGTELNTMTQNLATMTKEITTACHNMVSTLEEARRAVTVQSAGASEQASSINEITASITEIEKSSSQTMAKAKSLGKAAERTKEKGQTGLESVEQSVQSMKMIKDKVQMIAQTILDLSTQTQQVGEITAVVNNLAQQSKMLALNASIEAAKAGEAGKGFAVVAVEVKNLAEQSEQSTTQVQKILEDIRHATEKAVMVTEEGTKGVDLGMKLVEQTGDIIRSLNDVIHETSISTQQIEAAIRQEGAGIEQITIGMNEINQVTASFVESAKQTSEAMDNLAIISKNLKDQIDIYKL